MPNLRPLTGYIGGKWNLRKVICPRVDAMDHTCYVEPFMGMANVFLGLEKRRRVEVLNDTNDDVVNLVRLVQRHGALLADEVASMLTSRTRYADLFHVKTNDMTDIQRAARFLFLRRLTYSGKEPYEYGFSHSSKTLKAFDADETGRRILALRERLNRVVIEHLDFADCVRRYDGEKTLFYLDPPYWGRTGLYPSGTFRQSDFDRLAETLKAVKGSWIMSINDTPEVRELFSWASIKSVDTVYAAAVGKGSQPARELIVRG